MPSRSAASVMRAAPVRSGSSRPVEWLIPSGKMQTVSPAARAAETAAKVSAFLRRIDAVIDLAIDGNRAGAGQDRTERTVEERGLGEEPDVASGGRPDERGIEQRVRMIGQEQHGASLRHRADPIDAIEDPAGGPRQPADRGVRTRAHFR